jgi:hypothetical protein
LRNGREKSRPFFSTFAHRYPRALAASTSLGISLKFIYIPGLHI